MGGVSMELGLGLKAMRTLQSDPRKQQASSAVQARAAQASSLVQVRVKIHRHRHTLTHVTDIHSPQGYRHEHNNRLAMYGYL